MKALTPLFLAISTVFLTACATTQTTQTTQTALTRQETTAKNAVAEAVKSQLYSSFGYRTDIYVSNQIRREALKDAKASNEQGSCDEEHDKAYVALLKQVKKDGLKIDNEQYHDEKQTLKKHYQLCQETQRQKESQYQAFDFDGFYQRHKHDSTDEQAEEFISQLETHIAGQVHQESHLAQNNHTPLDAKKAQLLHEYLIKPSQISVVGQYNPFKGQLTALPNIGYHAKNLTLAINQPIQLDLRQGAMYLWADNFALANSQLVDKKLGDKWRNKWLYVPLNDGSLPAEFAKDLVQAYLHAKKESFWATPEHSFAKINPQNMADVPFLADTLPQDTLTLIKNTPLIIKHQTTPQDKAYSEYVFADVLYDTLTKKYPELTLEKALGYDNPNMYERDIIDGESVIHVGSANADVLDEIANQPVASTNIKFLMVMFMAGLKNQADLYTQSLKETDHKSSSPYAPSVHYGVRDGKIAWLHHRHYLTQQGLQGGQLTKTMLSETEPLFVDAFTQVYQGSNMGEFARLPKSAQMPTKDNSINVYEYKDELIKTLSNSDDDYLKMMATLILGLSDKETDIPLDDGLNEQ